MPREFEDLISVARLIKRNEQLDPDFYDPPPKVGVVAEPHTKAGQALLHAAKLTNGNVPAARDTILAIEAEAREELGQLFGITATRLGDDAVEFRVYQRGEPAQPPTVMQAGDTFTVTYTAHVGDEEGDD